MGLQIYYLLPEKNSFDKVIMSLFIVVLIHISFAAIFRDVVKGYQFVDRGAPFGMLYGPLLFFAFKSSQGKLIRPIQIFQHLIPFLILLTVFVYFLVSPTFRLNNSRDYYFALYSLFGLSWLFYPILLLFQGSRIDLALFNIKRIFYYSIILLLILSAIILPIIFSSFLNQESADTPISGATIYLIMLFGAVLTYNYMLKELAQRKILPTKILLNELVTKDIQNESVVDEGFKHLLYEERVLEYLKQETYLDPEFTIEKMQKDLKMSRSQLSQFFKEYYKQNVLKTINSLRIQAVCSALEQEDFDMNIEELALRCGFSSRASFYRNFSLEKDCTPFEYRDRIIKKDNYL